MGEFISTWWPVLLAALIFLGDVLTHKVAYGKDISRNNDRLNDHSNRIKENTDKLDKGLNKKVDKGDCRDDRHSLQVANQEWRQEMRDKFKDIKTELSSLNGKKKRK